MKRLVPVFLSIPVLLTVACNKEQVFPAPQPERELSVPEKVEKEIMDILSKDWKSLSDTMAYFNSNLLSKGILKGIAPDGVYYRLNVTTGDTSGLRMDFSVEDSIWVSVNGRIIPPDMKLHAFEKEIDIKEEEKDSISLRFSKIKAVWPVLFFLQDKLQASLLYEERRVGFITREEFENPDYSTGTYLVIHYYDDPRTFALYDNGLSNLLKISLKDVLE